MTNMPTRMLNLSDIQPMNGSTAKPGMIHKDATENPVARARGGIANERPANVAGPIIASDAEIKQFTAPAI